MWGARTALSSLCCTRVAFSALEMCQCFDDSRRTGHRRWTAGVGMIELTRLNATQVWINAAHIIMLEAAPDTILTLYNSEKLMVRESPLEVRKKMIEYFRTLGGVASLLPPTPGQVEPEQEE